MSTSGGGVIPTIGNNPLRRFNSFMRSSAFICRRLFSAVSSWRRRADSFCLCFALLRLFLTAMLLRSLRLWYSSVFLPRDLPGSFSLAELSSETEPSMSPSMESWLLLDSEPSRMKSDPAKNNTRQLHNNYIITRPMSLRNEN